MNFCAHHFPIGTQFTLNDDMRLLPEQKQPEFFVCHGVVRNGIDSYVIKTGRMREHTGEEGFNISHVNRILKRGSGPLSIDHGYYGVRDLRGEDPWDCKAMDWTGPLWGHKPKKGFWFTLSIEGALHVMAKRVVPVGTTLDYKRLSPDARDQAWVHTIRSPSTDFFGFAINKKRLRRWLAANWVRYQIPVRALLKREEEQQRADYERMMDEMDLDSPDDEDRLGVASNQIQTQLD